MTSFEHLRWALGQQRLLLAERFASEDGVQPVVDDGLQIEEALTTLVAAHRTEQSLGEATGKSLEIELHLDAQLREIELLIDAIMSTLGVAAQLADQINGSEATIHAQLSDNASRLRTI